MSHLDKVKSKLVKKKKAWKLELVSSISLAHKKLNDYHHIGDQQRGKPNHWATILDPTVKLQLYQKLYPSKLQSYKNDFIHEYQRSYAKFETARNDSTFSYSNYSHDTATSFLDMACAEQKLLLAPAFDHSQLMHYLESPVMPLARGFNVLLYWKNLERSHQGLTQMIKDVYGSPIAGVGIERKFLGARKTCHFQRHNLEPETMTSLTMVKDYEGYLEKETRESFGSKTEEGESTSYDDEDSTIAKEQYISDDEDS
jgi:hypothetical protein